MLRSDRKLPFVRRASQRERKEGEKRGEEEIRGGGKKERKGREGPGMVVHACNHSKEVEIGGSLALAN